jgi:predicted metal-dependent hydrolase
MAGATKEQLQLSITRHDNRVESRKVMERLRRDARQIAANFGLSYRELRAEKPGVNHYYGVCYRNGCIHIRLRHATTGRLLRYSSLIDTVCHELAHLRHFDHSERFEALYERMLGYAREQGIYRPSRRNSRQQEPPPQGLPDAIQLPLFGGREIVRVIAGRKSRR